MIALQACKIERAYNAIEVYNYFEAKKLFEKKIGKSEVAAPYGLSIIYGRKDNPFYNLDSAYKYIYWADSNLSSLEEADIKQLNKYNIDTNAVKNWKDTIDVKRFRRVNKAINIESIIQYIEKHPTSIKLEKAIQLRDSLAFKMAESENTSEAYKSFLSRYPQANEAYLAQNRYDKLLFAEKTQQDRLEDYRTFVKENPESPYLREAQDSVYSKSTSAGGIQAYHRFIQQNSSNPNVNKAWRNLYKLYITDYSPERIAEFRIDYPDYPFVEDLMLDIDLASKHFLPIKVDSLWGFMDLEGKLMIKPSYSSVEPFSEGLALVVKAGKVGFINKSGEAVIPIMYEDAEPFESAVTVVSKSNKYGIIDRTNKVVVPIKYEFVGAYFDGLAVVANDSAYGYVNKSGQIAIPLSYDYAANFNQGLAVIEKDGKKGVINTQGGVVVPLTFNWLESFQPNGLSRAKKDSLYGLINQEAKQVLPYTYDAIGEFSDGLAVVAKGDQYGYINDSAQWVIESKFDFRRDALNWGKFRNSYAKYMLKEKFGVIDTSGKSVFPAIFENIGYYNDSSLIAVKKRGKWGFTDQDLNLVIPYQYEFAETFGIKLAKVKIEGQWGLIDERGKEVLKAEFEDIQTFDFGYLVKKEGKQGLLNLDLEELLPLKYERIRPYNDHLLSLETDNSHMYYNTKENSLIKLQNR